MYYIFNKILFEEIDNTHIAGSRPIDTYAITPNIMECVEGCKLIKTNDIIIIDYRAYIIDINFKKYF